MSSIGATPCAAPMSNARAEASRRNGAKSCGPKTPEGKARSAQNALKHGFRATKHMVLPGEDAAAFAALEAALLEELAPEGALQGALAQRVVSALIRECNGARAFDTLLRYRGGALAGLSRALRTLKALQAEQAAPAPRESWRIRAATGRERVRAPSASAGLRTGTRTRPDTHPRA